MTNLLLAIRSLEIGGAERQCLELVKKLDRRRFRINIATMRPGTLEPEVSSDPSIRIVQLRRRGRFDLSFLWRFSRLIDETKPDVVYSFMFDMNVFAALSTWTARHRPKLVWGIFGSEPKFAEGPRFIRVFFALMRLLEWRTDLITSDSLGGFAFLRKYGFRLKKTATVFSGTDTRRFRRDAEARRHFRAANGLQEHDIAVGICSRLVAMKGYPVLAEAARRLLVEYKDLRFFAVGYGDDRIREECVRILGETAPRFTWLGKQQEPEELLSGWDIYCSSSVYGEGFSNSIIEAMACELPCVVTDVGDAAIQVGDTGIVVAPGNVDELAEALRTMIADEEREPRGRRARARVLEIFTAETMVSNTAKALTTLLNEGTSDRRLLEDAP